MPLPAHAHSLLQVPVWEMASIKDIDVAFLPCNQPYTMSEKGLNWWGFGLLPAGGHEKGDFFDITYSSYMWTSDGKAFEVRYYGDSPYYSEKSAESAFSVRCIED